MVSAQSLKWVTLRGGCPIRRRSHTWICNMAVAERQAPSSCDYRLSMCLARPGSSLRRATIKPYAGPAVMCSVSYEQSLAIAPIFRWSNIFPRAANRDRARAYAGTRLLAPFRLSVASTLANLMIEANRFETIMAPAPADSPPNIAHPSDTSAKGRDGGDERCVQVRSGIVVCQKVPEAASKER
jgi:hypothetical protein